MMISSGTRQAGFTLIEVLVALSIVVVSFMALYSVIGQMVNATTLMQEKTLASWIAYDRITELRVSGEFPGVGEKSDDLEMGGTRWLYTVEIRATASEDLRQIIVTVAPEYDPERILGLASGALPRIKRGATGGQPNGQPDADANGPPDGVVQ